MKVLRKTKGPIFLIRLEVHVPSPSTMKTGRLHFAVSRSNTTADRVFTDLTVVLVVSQQLSYEDTQKHDTAIKGTGNIRFPYVT
jgi:hypothetical protein